MKGLFNFDHTDTNEAMFAALVVINKLILELSNCEEMARSEALNVAEQLKTGGLTTAELTDLLHQAVIDFRSNKTNDYLLKGEGNKR